MNATGIVSTAPKTTRRVRSRISAWRASGFGVLGFLRARLFALAHLVARRLDRRLHLRDRDLLRVEGHGHALGAEVHVDAVDPGQLLDERLDVGDAGGAGHAAADQRELHLGDTVDLDRRADTDRLRHLVRVARPCCSGRGRCGVARSPSAAASSTTSVPCTMFMPQAKPN